MRLKRLWKVFILEGFLGQPDYAPHYCLWVGVPRDVFRICGDDAAPKRKLFKPRLVCAYITDPTGAENHSTFFFVLADQKNQSSLCSPKVPSIKTENYCTQMVKMVVTTTSTIFIDKTVVLYRNPQNITLNNHISQRYLRSIFKNQKRYELCALLVSVH